LADEESETLLQSQREREREIIANDTGIGTIAPTVEQLFNLVTRKLTGDRFARIFMLISLAIFLCPTSYGSASRHYYSAIASVVDIPKYDWCSILDCLVDGIAKFKNSTVKANTVGKDRTSSLCGCFFVLVVGDFLYPN
jgi:hypothetical protein